jgi:hypothetical protein
MTCRERAEKRKRSRNIITRQGGVIVINVVIHQAGHNKHADAAL